MLTFSLVNVDGKSEISGTLSDLRNQLQESWIRNILNDPVWKGRDDVVCVSILMGEEEVGFLEQEESRQFIIQLLTVK